MDFETANNVVHRVESQWHYPILTKHGFTAQTKEVSGFVREYVYTHPDGRTIKCCTGCSSDYWVDAATKKQGYWSDLEKHVKGN